MDVDTIITGLEEYTEVLGENRKQMLADIWRTQESHKPQGVHWAPSNMRKLERRLHRNKPMLLVDPPQMDLAWFKRTFDAIRAVIREYAAEKDMPIFTASSDSITERDIRDGVVYTTDTLTAIAKRLGVPDDDRSQAGMAAMAVLSTIRPFAREAVKNAPIDVREMEILSEPCPLCGASAALSIVRGDGETEPFSRTLYCTNCESQWAYPVHKCTNCGDEESRNHTYFQHEGDPAHRMYFCRKCQSALPTVFASALGYELNARVEEAVALPITYSLLDEEAVRAYIEEG